MVLRYCRRFPCHPLQAQEANKDILGAMRYRYIGPVGNRVTSVVERAGQANLYYVGAASGGIFKTTDGGIHWEPIFDGKPVSSIGSLDIAPSDPNIVGQAQAKHTFVVTFPSAPAYINPPTPVRPGS